MDIKKIGYLGPRATFTAQAVTTLFPEKESKPLVTIPACIDAVVNGEVDVAVVPIENTIEGSVNLTIDYLIHEQPLKIIGEVIIPISQHLMVHPYHSSNWKEIEGVYSHPHAIAQCHKFLYDEFQHTHFEYTTSTAAAAKYISENPHQKFAAIANELAAKEYGLSIVKRDIHDFENNHTRFVVLHKNFVELDHVVKESSGNKTTLMITLPSDRAGALHQVLSAFAWRKLNLSKIESRPMKTGLGNYFFLIDIEQRMDDVLIPSTIAELEALECGVKVLGSYPYFRI
ncbi:prephenate dehydratase [Fredinandcohnia quinoae]|uniref:Prephenate dehydratase n=1 Tax=Fredinandcohnia quinoae TaxID=2918902 RepID=A0AAW5E952_9BACI|nr:prephenate dehydratase [Fredinandcohnia sp. SECRCQ15]MCH1626547.1 prephenate dehydratase [Fredinandcohnia sp. SECRCQ15]